NGQRYVAQAIESILGQSFEDFELIISDNASTDGTLAICARYAAKDRRIRILRNKVNVGAARNFNLTFAHASGTYFKWAAADDLIGPGYLARAVEALEADPSLVLCQGRTTLIDEDGVPLPYDAATDRYIDRAGRLRIGPRQRPIAQSDDPVARFREVVRNTPPCFDVFGVTRTAVLARTSRHAAWYGSDRALLAELALYDRFGRMEDAFFFNREHSEQSIVLSPKEQARWVGPDLASRVLPPGLHFRAQLARAVLASPLSLSRKYQCLAFLCGRSGYIKLLGSHRSCTPAPL